MKHSNNHIGRITIFSIIVAATLGIAMAGGLVRWQGITDLFKGDSPEKTAKVPATTTAKAPNNENYAHTTAFSGMPFMLSVEGCSITGEAGSMDGTSEIEIMAIDSLPPLAAGMVNVTRGHAGYRLSPAGLRFARPVSVELGYDSLLLPKGHSAREIRTFLYNSEKRHWEALPRDSVMEGSQNIVSQSKQAGEMINAIVQLPELPESKAFTPTMLTELEAAHPATGITMMEPPAANSQGTANLSYPITVPAGRNGLQPNLSVSYSSEAGNGLLGMGWDMQLPAITVDSKWGVPRYDSLRETECYSYNGQELLPSPHYLAQWENRNLNANSTKVFRPRTEGSFEKIERHGNSPKRYFWVVTDKGGTKYYYGTYDGSTVATSVLLKDGSGNIGHWPLCRVEDLDGNFMTYHYTVREQYDAGNNYLGKQLWPDSIVYTGHRNGNAEERGRYRVVFSSGFHPRFRLMQALELNQSDPDGQTNGTDSTYQDLGDGCDIKIRVRKRDRRTGTLLSGAVFNLHNNTNDMCLTTNSIGEAVWRLETYDDYNLFLREETPPSGWCTRMQDISLHVVKVSGACHLDVSALDVHVDSVIYENTLGTEVRIVVTNDICGDEAYQCVDVCDCDSVWDDLEGEYPYDMRTDARLGFLRSSKEKMRRMVVYYRDSVVRSYSFCYGRDIFGRAQLRSIRQYGADCSEEPFTHTFSYYRDADSVRLESGGHDVDNAGRVDNTGSGSFLSKAARVVEQAARDLVSAETAIGGSLNLSGGGGGGADIGLGLNVCSKEASAGYSLGYSAGIGTGLATLADIDGDGLPDRMYLRDNQVYYKPQVAGGNAFGTERKLGASSFLSDNSATFHHGPAVNVGQAHGGLGWSSTVSRTSVYIADVNGDGLTDLVNNGRAVTIQPAHTSPVISGAGGCGLPSVTDGEDSAARISLKCVPSVEMAGGADTVSYDLVRVWRSAGNGMYKIHAPVKVLGDTLAGVFPTRDSILVSVEFYGKRFATDINRSHFLIASKWLEPGENAWTGNLLSLTGELAGGVAGFLDCDQLPISEGMLFFRVRSKGGRPVSHAVEWDPQVVLGANPAKKASECQLLEGSGRLHCPFTGVLRLRDTLDPQGMNGSVDYIMRRNNAVFRNYPYSYSSPGLGQATYYNDTLHVRRDDSLEFSVVASSGDGIVANQWRPHLYYETVTDSNTNGKLDTVSMLLLSGVAADTVLLMELFPVPGYSFPAHTVHPLFGGMYGGWGHFQYRHDERDTLDTVAVNAFADSIAAFNRNTLDRYGYMNDTDFLKRIFDSGNPIPMDTLDSIRMRFRCLPLWANGETRRHEGICPNSYIDGKRICLGNYVLPELVVKNNDSLFATQGAYAGTGTVAGSATGAAPSSPASAMVFSSLDKISESSSRSYTCGAWMFGASYSHGTSATTHDLMDLNGDGCPDFIRPGGNVYYSLPHLSIWEAAARQTLPSGGYHLSSNKTAGGNFTAQSAHTVQKSTNSGKGQNVIIERSVSNSLNAGVNTNISGDRVEHTLTDINGDGLPDMLYSDGKVALNTGYGFTPRRIWGGIEKIGVYSSVAGGADVSSGTGADGAVWQEVMDNPKNSSTVMGKGARKFTQKSAWKASISGGASFTLSLNQHQVTLA
ncbi:MAG: hypothetical protein IKX13_05230, partial [Bacteroidales bacterium]|nr:hypothetical protein [Bacteroidales bacterium]